MSGRLLSIEELEQLAKLAKFHPARMADLWPISARQMERIFLRDYQLTPTLWLRQLQCRLAKELISRGYSNKSVAAELHFASESHFCREFRKIFGNSPQRFAPRAFRAEQNVANGQECR